MPAVQITKVETCNQKCKHKKDGKCKLPEVQIINGQCANKE